MYIPNLTHGTCSNVFAKLDISIKEVFRETKLMRDIIGKEAK